MDFAIKLKNLLLLLVIPLILSTCSVSQHFQASANTNVGQRIDSKQLAETIKKDINQNFVNQSKKGCHQAKNYTKYLNGIIEQVKEKEISEEDARNLLRKTYRHFKTRTYNFQNEKLLNDSPLVIPQETSIPYYIPPKPGAL
jgi:Asp-tRNA(Asn)/Glu-tRNA(Gln) amidotransferase B subunit